MCHVVWRKENVPEDWEIELTARIPKKGNLAECLKWRGVPLFSIVSKLLAIVHLKRLKKN